MPSSPARAAVPPAYLAKSAALMEAGKFAEAAALLRVNLRRDPPARALLLLGLACDALGEFDAAIYHLHAARGADPSDPEIVLQLADQLADRKLFDEAVGAIDGYLARCPPRESLVTIRAAILAKAGRLDDAGKAAEQAMSLFPESREALSARAFVHRAAGRIDEAVTDYSNAGMPLEAAAALVQAGDPRPMLDMARQAVAREPKSPVALGYLAFALNYDDRCTATEIAAVHREFGRAMAAQLPAATSWNITPDPERRLRIGFMSPDLRQHACVSFVRVLFEMRKRNEWELFCYALSPIDDAVSQELRAQSDHWRRVPRPNGAGLADQIRKDRIDVLIDLAGNTQGHRLDAVQRRPAPVQLTWLGYPNTTGLSTVQARLIDSRTDPLGAEALATEELVRLDPCFLCYRPMLAAPEPRRDAQPGANEDAPIVFGSFNLPLKLTPKCLGLWATALRAVPGSTLVLKHISLKEEWMRERLFKRLEAAGLSRSLIRILPPNASFQEHLDAYAQFDIALDSYPYHGTTTTCEALWMGVPVITLRGDRHAARVGDSLLNAAGLGELVAGSPAEFAVIAARLAADRERLRTWRAAGPGSLREIMRQSSLCDGAAFSTRFHAAVRTVWREWCVKGAAA